MWAVFHCLARGALVMHTGSEDTSRLQWDRNIVHFDIKPANGRYFCLRLSNLNIHFQAVLLGARTTDNEHRDLPIFKVRKCCILTLDMTDSYTSASLVTSDWR